LNLFTFENIGQEAKNIY